MNQIFAECESKMKKSAEHFIKELGALRTGRASTSVLDGIRVPYYGNEMPINQVASLAVIEAKTIDIKPWDKGALAEIEKAIIASNLGVSVTNTGDSLKVRFPELTEETRKDMVKKVKKMAEETKVDIRNIKRDANEKAKEKELTNIRNQKIGFIFQKYHLIPTYNVLQNIVMPLLMRGMTLNE